MHLINVSQEKDLKYTCSEIALSFSHKVKANRKVVSILFNVAFLLAFDLPSELYFSYWIERSIGLPLHGQ